MYDLMGQCYNAFVQNHSIMATLFIAGLVGGLTHCSGMCGPFVVAQIDAPPPSSSFFAKLLHTSLVPYHLGRMTTYILLGTIASLLSYQIIGTPMQKWLSIVFLVSAGLIFITSTMPRVKLWINNTRTAQFGAMLGKLAKPFWGSNKFLSHYALGLLLGFLPCGLIFAALMIVSTLDTPLIAALGMAVFTLGTFPALFLIGLGGQFAYCRWPQTMQMVVKFVLIFNGCSLFLLASRMI